MKPIELASKAAHSISYNASKRTAKKEMPVIPAAEPLSFADSQTDKFNVGFASCNITPDDLGSHTYWMAGYKIAKKVNGFLDPLTMNAMWLGCGDSGLIFLSCDLVGLTGCDVDEIRRSLSGFCDKVNCKGIIISCTHTHAGIDTMGYWGVLPKSGKDKKFMLTVFASCKYLCLEAYKNRKPGKLYYGNVSAPELVYRWREPFCSNDRLHRLRFVPDDGSTETWYLNFAAHPNTLGGNNTKLSADYPSYMRRAINEKRKTNIMFSISTIGATDLGHVSEDREERTMLGGRMLGEKAFEISNERQLKPDITYLKQNFVLPLDNDALVLMESLKVFSSKKCAADSALGVGLISEIDYIRIDDLQILTMPGEMFTELVYAGGYSTSETSATGEGAEVNPEPLSEMFNDDNLVIFGITNDMAGYAIPENDFILHETAPYLDRATDRLGRNHYHETNSCGKMTGRAICETCKIIKESVSK